MRAKSEMKIIQNNGRCSRSENPVFAWKRFSDKQFSFKCLSFQMKMKRKKRRNSIEKSEISPTDIW